ncbi:MAG TPA: GntR family transcriptional regulator [Candidatus Hydrogenedentes bacterium]|nr:GntR family transcriptional regulator [Candidatus Hydrogenedentota bacterium]HQE81852.1 GntR family transcriptional regulator [Candidatus Hydrogenedentota bacterium]HQH52531.1 GntR family transcriptional regulator [Candidatus Hydrogenedentota bacterium]HQM48094.1 GntR family transcriptional regulator [Candidatus Hydrogenedentota bacterium]
MTNSNDVTYSVNLDSPIAVYVQIENQIQFAIASGRIKPGFTLPSVREMSQLLDVNPNTVTKAYRDLELLELVHTRRGVGVTIAEKAPKICRDRTRPMVKHHLVDAVSECIACGLSESDVRNIVESTISSGTKPYEAPKKKK